MMTPEEQRQEEDAALQRERKALKRQMAFAAVHRQFLPIGNGKPTLQSLDHLDKANAEWHEATVEVTRIAEEIRQGKRK